ncbi:hypothetical protein D3C79_1080470 [compost metagenome]
MAAAEGEAAAGADGAELALLSPGLPPEHPASSPAARDRQTVPAVRLFLCFVSFMRF